MLVLIPATFTTCGAGRLNIHPSPFLGADYDLYVREACTPCSMSASVAIVEGKDGSHITRGTWKNCSFENGGS